ncbi:MAG: transglutaminase family protein [Gammaproteobacteria bacterium]
MKRIRIQHKTTYSFREEVNLLPHKLMIRPREGHDIYIENSLLQISPANNVKWQRDIYGNSIGIVTFAEPAKSLKIESDVVVRHYEERPLDFLVDEKALNFPFFFDPAERVDLIPYQTLCFPNDSEKLRGWLSGFWQPGQSIETFTLLDTISKFIVNSFTYNMREEAGVQRPAETLERGSGSCRDFATLFIEACRYFGLAARFVSGYLHCPESVNGHGSTHAWSEVYLPGAGWIGFDNTSGNIVGQEHIATAVTRHPADAPPISGSYSGGNNWRPRMTVRVDVNEVIDGNE